MVQTKPGAVLERTGIEGDHVATGRQIPQHPLPEKAEAALREAGLWDEAFIRQLAQLDRVTLDALSVIGAWDDLDWADMADAFGRMRHESPPSPLVEL